MTITTTDAQLVAGHLAGDPAALAGIYDRFADSLHDTAAAMLHNRDDAADVLQDVILIAAQKLGQLREPDRLKPWLFAILRNEVYRRTKQRKRTVATDFSNDDMAAASGFDMTDERELGAESEAAETTELAALVRGAARGLDERDQLVLELSVRQGLDGQDLADALGVSANQSYTLVHRMRERVEKSLGAFAVAKAGRKACDQLDSMLEKWDGEFTVLIRKRVARHIENCVECADSRRKVAPLALFAGAPVLAAPAALRDRILELARSRAGGPGTSGALAMSSGFNRAGGFPRLVAERRRSGAWIAPTAAACLLLFSAGTGFWWLGTGEQPATFQSAVATTPIDAGASTTTGAAPVSTGTVAAASPSNAGPAITTAASTPITTAATTTTVTPSTLPVTTPPPTTAPTTAPTAVPTAVPQAPQAPSATPRPPSATRPPAVRPPAATQPPVIAQPATTPAPRGTAAPGAPVTTLTPPPPPAVGQLTGSSTTLALGGDSSRAFTLSNPGGQPVSWSVGGGSPFSISPTSGVLPPGSSSPITVGLDRSGLAEGSQPSATVSFVGNGGQSVPLSISATVDRPPVISGIEGPSVTCVQYVFGGGTQTLWEAFVGASIFDESGGSATFTISGPGGRSGSGSAPISSNWSTQASNLPNGDTNQTSGTGTWNWSINATDSRGNRASATGTVAVTCV